MPKPTEVEVARGFVLSFLNVQFALTVKSLLSPLRYHPKCGLLCSARSVHVEVLPPWASLASRQHCSDKLKFDDTGTWLKFCGLIRGAGASI